MGDQHKTLRDLPVEENVAPGTMLCAGCGGVLLVRIFEKILGPNTITLNAAGCMSMLSVFPYTPFKSSWLYVAMASAPAAAQGVRDALDIMIRKGRIRPEDDLKVVVITGDGAAADIGLQTTSGALHRNLDFYYLVYDNEGYSNTGFQASGSSPFGAATKTTLPSKHVPEGSLLEKKDLFEIWRAHRPPYVATVSPAYIADMMRKVERASQFAGPKLFIAHSPCPPGWDIDSGAVIRLAKMAVETGVWPLKEAVHGQVTHSLVMKKRRPVEEYLKMQGRFEHLFSPARQEDVLQKIQAKVDGYWKSVTERSL
ncbi:thiamine pyrophosphate-dependent enzyme [Nitrososphaera sp.]|uniref:thiamine pyrophosphate-dependent enzyme n=1 Tax=Nitrososphaera sp. TaxID=1971748 RepID=UPI00307E386F